MRSRAASDRNHAPASQIVVSIPGQKRCPFQPQMSRQRFLPTIRPDKRTNRHARFRSALLRNVPERKCTDPGRRSPGTVASFAGDNFSIAALAFALVSACPGVHRQACSNCHCLSSPQSRCLIAGQAQLFYVVRPVSTGGRIILTIPGRPPCLMTCEMSLSLFDK